MKTVQHLFDRFDSELCLIGAPSNADLAREVQRLVDFLEHAPDVRLEDVAYTCNLSARHMPAVLAVVATSVQDLCSRLTIAQKKLVDNAWRIRDKSGTYYFRDRLCPRGRIAFVFPGVVSFYPDMLRDICTAFDCCRSTLDELDAALSPIGLPISDYVFPPTPGQRMAKCETAAELAGAAVCTYAANLAMNRLFEQLGIIPDGLAGLSGGDLAALAAGKIYGDLPYIKRVRFMREGFQMLQSIFGRDDLTRCEMFAVIGTDAETIERLKKKYPGRIAVTMQNSLRQFTLAFSPEISAEAVADLNANGIKTVHVPIHRPFNTPWCAKQLTTIKQFLSHWIKNRPAVPVYSFATSERLPDRASAILKISVDQWALPLRFSQTIRQMYDDGYRIFIEMGARGNLTSCIDDTLGDLPHQTIAVNRIHRSGLTQLHHALAMLAAHGVQFDATELHRHRRRNQLDFGKPLSVAPTPNHQLRLTHAWPAPCIAAVNFANAGSAPIPRQFEGTGSGRCVDYGADLPMLANAEIVSNSDSLLEIRQVLTLQDFPFLNDYSIGSGNISHVNPKLRGLTIFSLISGMEIMCETARKLVPRQRVARVDNLRSQRWLGFKRGMVRISVKAERIAWSEPGITAVRVQLRDDQPNFAYTWPVMDCVVLLTADELPAPPPAQPEPLPNAHSVNWSARDIYPDRLFHGEALQTIKHVDLWSEGGIDYEVEVPKRSRAVRATRFPLFSVWPTLLDGIVSGFSLWRSHEKFAGAISMPFRARRIVFHTSQITEGARLRGYLRLFSVTPASHVADISVTDGNGKMLLEFKGWEEICERVPPEYQQFIMRPAEKYITHPLPLELLGNPQTPIAGSVVCGIPTQIFEKNQELWLKTLANVLLSPAEREEWAEMQGSVSRRVEWLFGRAAAKESARRFLDKYHQSRWTAADITIWADDAGKPHPIGPWKDRTPVELDLSIAHTGKLVVAAIAAHARIGIDIESLGRSLTDEFTNGVFTAEELELAAHTGETPVTILLFWCAKEAISKAIGTGIRFSPRDLVITSYNPMAGTLEIELTGQWLPSFKFMRGRKNVIYTSIYEEHAFAACVLPCSLFDNA